MHVRHTEQSAPQSTNIWERLAVLVVLVPSFQNCFVPTILELASFLQRPLGFVVQSLPLGNSMFGTTGGGSFWWRNLELIRRRSSPCRTFWYFAKVSDIFHVNSTQCQFPKINYNLGIVSWKRFRKARRSRCCPCRWSTPSTLRWTCQSFRSYLSPAGKTPCSDDSRTAESTFWPFLGDSCPVVGL